MKNNYPKLIRVVFYICILIVILGRMYNHGYTWVDRSVHNFRSN